MRSLKFQIDKTEIKDNGASLWTGKLLVLKDGEYAASWPCLSGGWGKGAIPKGEWAVGAPHRFSQPDSGQLSPYRKEGFPWYARLTPIEEVPRDGFLIHPDGNVPGSLGCLVIAERDIELFWVLSEIFQTQKELTLIV